MERFDQLGIARSRDYMINGLFVRAKLCGYPTHLSYFTLYFCPGCTNIIPIPLFILSTSDCDFSPGATNMYSANSLFTYCVISMVLSDGFFRSWEVMARKSSYHFCANLQFFLKLWNVKSRYIHPACRTWNGAACASPQSKYHPDIAYIALGERSSVQPKLIW